VTFANLLPFINRRAAPVPAGPVVEEVYVSKPEPRDPRVERFILICWGLIAVKHVAVIWAVWHYHVPFHQLWVNAPTWLLGVVATLLYYNLRD
jgi:hypothetical protein